MNQKEISKIAEILKIELDNAKMVGVVEAIERTKIIIISLADYFEEEDEVIQEELKESRNEYPKKVFKDFEPFNRKLFLKDCGVMYLNHLIEEWERGLHLWK